MKVCVAIPAQDQGPTTFWMCFVNLILHHGAKKDLDVSVTQMNGCYLDLLRNQLIESALKTKPDFIMFLDSDMVFPNDTISRLVAHDKDVVGCNYTRRRPPYDPIATEHPDYNKRVDMVNATGLGLVSVIPTGVLLIKPHVFEKMVYPWFDCIWRDSDKRYIGEDVVFCSKLGSLKIPVYCDHDLSKEIKHSGQFDFGVDMLRA